MPAGAIRWINGRARIIDQRKLPLRLEYVDIKDIRSMWRAIRNLEIRGAPAIGVAAAFGLFLGVKKARVKDYRQLKKRIDAQAEYLASSRPTAVNLFWALDRMRVRAEKSAGLNPERIKKALLQEALAIMKEDRRSCARMASFGAGLIKTGERVLTYCNTGALAAVDYGTALGALFKAKKEGKKIKVFACETRPLLQGARLTAWELMRENIDVTLICDNMAASLMAKGLIDKVFVGADRIAKNGDTANKIGTYNLAVLARFHKIPFYVVAPSSTFDLTLPSGRHIPIEQRPGGEVTAISGKRTAPRKVKVYNPAFDVTPRRLITAIVTEKGVFAPGRRV